MKKFILKFALLVACIYFVPVFVLLFICPQYTHEYSSAIFKKVQRLESLKSPKIILVGNSNLVFGIKSELIEKAFNRPVENLGFHAGAGNVFNERLALFNIGEGDIVIVSNLTYDDKDRIGDYELALITVENYFHMWKIFRLKDYPGLIQTIPRYSYKSLFRFFTKADRTKTGEEVWDGDAFNEYGDMGRPHPAPLPSIYYAPFAPNVGKICMDRLRDFAEYCRIRGGVCLIAGMPIADTEKSTSVKQIEQFQVDLERMAPCPVISDCKDYLFAPDMFYDNNAHLTDEGARLRTEQLIKDLKAFLAGQGSDFQQ